MADTSSKLTTAKVTLTGTGSTLSNSRRIRIYNGNASDTIITIGSFTVDLAAGDTEYFEKAAADEVESSQVTSVTANGIAF